MTDAFALLQLPRRPWLDAGEVRAAFQRLAATTHPDRFGSTTAFVELTRAYETLRDPAQRLRHFLALEQPGLGAGEMPADLVEWFPGVAHALKNPAAAESTLAELAPLRDHTHEAIRQNAANLPELTRQLSRLAFLDKWIAQLEEALLAQKL